MDEINHFSHEDHPLKLIELRTIVDFSLDSGNTNEKPRDISCYACAKPISSGVVYACTQCRYFLHKACAQLPHIIRHHSFHKHPLTLTDCRAMNFTHWTCDVCLQRRVLGLFYTFEKGYNVKWFTACTECCVIELARKAEADIIKEEARIKVEHKGHPQHTLTLKLRPGAFRCDACNAKEEGLFYECNSCDFWIHKTCASLAATIHLPQHHDHPLVLVYSLPEKFYNFTNYCEFCSVYIRQNDWLYHCANCRFFAHIKCALNAQHSPNTPRDDHSTSTADEDESGLLRFPMLEAFTDPLKQLHFEKSAQDINEKTNINHWSHHHPLTLVVKAQANTNDEIEVCHGCIRPLSHPYYTCKYGCSFTLHKYCVELPLKLDHPLHQSHSLQLINKWGHEYYYKCIGCWSYGNTFCYSCETCKFNLDVNCAFLPIVIKHNSHKHPLIQVIDPKPLCNACDKWGDGMSYACKDCNFLLGLHCAMRLPQALAHRYCKGHEIPLTYPPVMDHPEDFFCNICEEEMHPKHPLYYCHKCKNSFHLDCINQCDLFENIFGRGTWNFSNHKHPLTYVRRKKTPKYVCSICNCDINGQLILECRARICGFNICFTCHRRKKR